MAETNGEIRNKTLLRYLNDILEEIKIAGNSNSSNFTNDTIDKGEFYIKREDEDIYNAIIKMSIYLEHKQMDPDSTYVIPGVMFPDENGNMTKAVMYIPIGEAEKLAEEAEVMEHLLGISLPTQIYQLKRKYDNSKVPGWDVLIPEPRLLSETNEEYEERLAQDYLDAGLKIDTIADTETRNPYPHEKVNYRFSDEEEEFFTSEAYQYYLYHSTRRQVNNNRHPEPAQPHPTLADGEAEVITESEDYDRTPLWQRIGTALHISESSIKSKSNHQKLKILALLGAGTAGSVALLLNPATQPATIAALGIGAIIFGIKKASDFSKKHLGPKLRNLFFGRKREEPEEEQTQSQSPQQQQQEQQNPPSGAGADHPSPSGDIYTIPEEIEAFLREMNIDIPNLRQARIEIVTLQQEIADIEHIDPQSPELPQKKGELLNLINNFKEQLNYVAEYARSIIAVMQQEDALNRGGHTHGSN